MLFSPGIIRLRYNRGSTLRLLIGRNIIQRWLATDEGRFLHSDYVILRLYDDEDALAIFMLAALAAYYKISCSSRAVARCTMHVFPRIKEMISRLYSDGRVVESRFR